MDAAREERIKSVFQDAIEHEAAGALEVDFRDNLRIIRQRLLALVTR